MSEHADTGVHERLVSWLAESGLDTTAAQELLWLINAPANLQSLVDIANQLTTLLPQAKDCADSPDTLDLPWDAWQEICRFVADHPTDVIKHIGAQALSTSRPDRTPMFGVILKHPFYALLYYSCVDPTLARQFEALKAHFLLAHAELLLLVASLENYQESIEPEPQSALLLGSYNSCVDKACLTARAIALEPNEHYEALLIDLDPQGRSQSEFRDIVLDKDKETPHHPAFALFFERAYGISEPVSRSGGGSHTGHQIRRLGQVNPNIATRVLVVPGDIDEPGYIHLSQPPCDFPTREEWRDAGLDPAENFPEFDLTLLDVDCPETPASAAARAYAAIARARHIVMANQHLPLAWPQPTLHEIAVTMKACRARFEEIADDIRVRPLQKSDQRVLQLAIPCLVMVMVWTGSTFDRARQLVQTSDPRKMRHDLVHLPEQREWRVKPALPSYRTHYSPRTRAKARARSEYFYIPDIFGIGRFLVRHQAITSPKHQRLVPRTAVKTVRDELRRFLDSLPVKERITERKLSSFLFQHLVTRTGGDVCTAILITGHGHYTGVTQLHYSAPRGQRLREIYIDCVQDLVSRIYEEAIDKPAPKAQLPKEMRNHIGARATPTTATIRDAVAELQGRIRALRNTIDLPDIVRLHNYYTLYTALYFGYATGYRAVTDPFISSAMIDPEHGIATICDKQGGDHNKSRLIWIPDAVRQQLAAYETHRAKLLGNLAGRSDLNESITSAPDLFLLTDALRIEHIRPGTASPWLDPIYPFPLNANRHYLRTYLMEHDCPGEIINAFMGHWSRGEEPWGRFSTLSPLDYVDTIKPHIEASLDAAGWRVLRGWE